MVLIRQNCFYHKGAQGFQGTQSNFWGSLILTSALLQKPVRPRRFILEIVDRHDFQKTSKVRCQSLIFPPIGIRLESFYNLDVKVKASNEQNKIITCF